MSQQWPRCKTYDSRPEEAGSLDEFDVPNPEHRHNISSYLKSWFGSKA